MSLEYFDKISSNTYGQYHKIQQRYYFKETSSKCYKILI